MKNSTTTSKYPLTKDKIWARLPERVQSLEDNAPNYKTYSVLFTQNGTSVPVITILENTLGLTLTWGRSGAGNYFAGDIASKCPDEKTVFITSNSSNGGAFGVDPKQAYLWAFNSGASRFLNFNIRSISTSGTSTAVDWNSPKALLLEIRVYN
jgi:hypothetical protein